MPLFEFHCRRCEHEFEALIRAGDAPECPDCGSREADKLLSTVAAHMGGRSLPMASSCPPSDAPPCHPGCCRLPG